MKVRTRNSRRVSATLHLEGVVSTGDFEWPADQINVMMHITTISGVHGSSEACCDVREGGGLGVGRELALVERPLKMRLLT